MFLDPKIFISSTFKENEKIRKSIKEYFESVGAIPLLYEYNLTPSTEPLTYRKDILAADFIILIIKDNYGTKTKSGFSGIHEEYRIAINNGIPMHVYLKKNKEKPKVDCQENEVKNEEKPKADCQENELVDEVKNDQISYYYFEDDDDLLKQLKKTTFIIGKEIYLKDITKSNLPRDTIINLASNTDYNRAMEVISIIESMCRVAALNRLDWIYSNIFVECMECIQFEFLPLKHGFINWQIDELLKQMLVIANEFMDHSTIDFISIGICRKYKISILGEIEVRDLGNNGSSIWGIDNYQNCLKNFFDKYEEFKKLVQDIKIEADLIK